MFVIIWIIKVNLFIMSIYLNLIFISLLSVIVIEPKSIFALYDFKKFIPKINSNLYSVIDSTIYYTPPYIIPAAAFIALTGPTYPVHLHRFPEIPSLISSSEGLGFLSSNALADITIPGMQYPHE